MELETQQRFVVVREQLRTNKAAVGGKLIDLPGYVFRAFVTNRFSPGNLTRL